MDLIVQSEYGERESGECVFNGGGSGSLVVLEYSLEDEQCWVHFEDAGCV